MSHDAKFLQRPVISDPLEKAIALLKDALYALQTPQPTAEHLECLRVAEAIHQQIRMPLIEAFFCTPPATDRLRLIIYDRQVATLDKRCKAYDNATFWFGERGRRKAKLNFPGDYSEPNLQPPNALTYELLKLFPDSR